MHINAAGEEQADSAAEETDCQQRLDPDARHERGAQPDPGTDAQPEWQVGQPTGQRDILYNAHVISSSATINGKQIMSMHGGGGFLGGHVQAVAPGISKAVFHVVYQPESHFWSLQLTETGLFAGIAAILIPVRSVVDERANSLTQGRSRRAAPDPVAATAPVQAARRRTSQTVAAMSSADSASSQPPSMNWNGQNRLAGW